MISLMQFFLSHMSFSKQTVRKYDYFLNRKTLKVNTSLLFILNVSLFIKSFVCNYFIK